MPDLLALVGAAGLLLSLWLHWYTFHVPGVLIDRAESLAGRFGSFGPLLTQGAEQLRHLGALHLTAWQVLSQIDVVLALIAGVAGTLALTSMAGRPLTEGGPLAMLGTAAVTLCGYRLLVVPGPEGVLHPDMGIYLALACGLAVSAGGVMDRSAPARPSFEIAPLGPDAPLASGYESAAWTTAGSVPPPSA